MPWDIGGDFNHIFIIMSIHLRLLMRWLQTWSISVIAFFRWAFFTMFHDLLHTWSNKQPSQPNANKLERILVNQSWIVYFSNNSAMFHPPEFSDHFPCTLDLATPLPTSGTKPFKYFNYLTRHPNFLCTMAEAWIIAVSTATFLGNLFWKLKYIKEALKTLNWELF